MVAPKIPGSTGEAAARAARALHERKGADGLKGGNVAASHISTAQKAIGTAGVGLNVYNAQSDIASHADQKGTVIGKVGGAASAFVAATMMLPMVSKGLSVPLGWIGRQTGWDSWERGAKKIEERFAKPLTKLHNLPIHMNGKGKNANALSNAVSRRFDKWGWKEWADTAREGEAAVVRHVGDTAETVSKGLGKIAVKANGGIGDPVGKYASLIQRWGQWNAGKASGWLDAAEEAIGKVTIPSDSEAATHLGPMREALTKLKGLHENGLSHDDKAAFTLHRETLKNGLEKIVDKHQKGGWFKRSFFPDELTGNIKRLSKSINKSEGWFEGAFQKLGKVERLGDIEGAFAKLPKTLRHMGVGKYAIAASVLGGVGAAMVHAHRVHKADERALDHLRHDLEGVRGAAPILAHAEKDEASHEHHGMLGGIGAGVIDGGQWMMGMRGAMLLMPFMSQVNKLQEGARTPGALPVIYEGMEQALGKGLAVPPDAYAMLLTAGSEKIAKLDPHNHLLGTLSAELAEKQAHPKDVMAQLADGSLDRRASEIAAELEAKGRKAGAVDAAKPTAPVAANENAPAAVDASPQPADVPLQAATPANENRPPQAVAAAEPSPAAVTKMTSLGRVADGALAAGVGA